MFFKTKAKRRRTKGRWRMVVGENSCSDSFASSLRPVRTHLTGACVCVCLCVCVCARVCVCEDNVKAWPTSRDMTSQTFPKNFRVFIFTFYFVAMFASS